MSAALSMAGSRLSRTPTPRWRLFGPIVLVMLIAGCSPMPTTRGDSLPLTQPPPLLEAAASSTPPASPATIQLQGQLSLKLGPWAQQTAKGVSLGFFFAGNAQAGQLDLMTPLGSQMAQVGWQGRLAWLDDGQQKRQFDSLDQLSEEALGEALPLQAMVHWMQGQPAPFLPSSPLGPDRFEQVGWTIDTSALPQLRLQAQRPGTAWQRAVLIKIHLDR